MDCPACDAQMREFELDGVMVDDCLRCGGVWLDAGEAKDLVKQNPSPREALQKKKFDLLRQWKVAAVDGGRETDRTCPRCPSKLFRVNYKDIPGLQVDTCKDEECGIYLDKGELEKIRLID